MTPEQILDIVANSNWQPEFEYCDDLNAVVEAINKPHEDNFLGLNDKVKEIIERGTDFATSNEIQGWYNGNYQITFADVCNWQEELFEYKHSRIDYYYNNSDYSTVCPESLSEEEETLWYQKQRNCTDIYKKSKSLPNLFINLGLRQTNVKVGNHTPPNPLFLDDLKSMCFPILVSQTDDCKLQLGGIGRLFYSFSNDYTNQKVVNKLTLWYKIFQTICYFEDFNGRLGAIVINILSYILTGKYLIKKYN